MGNACEPLAGPGAQPPSAWEGAGVRAEFRVWAEAVMISAGFHRVRVPPGWEGVRVRVSWVRRSTNPGKSPEVRSLMPTNIPAPVAGAGGEGRRVRSPGGCESR